MKYIASLLTIAILLSACKQESTLPTSLQELNNEKELVKIKIDSLSSHLKLIEAEISKLDTTKKLQIVTITTPKSDAFKHFF